MKIIVDNKIPYIQEEIKKITSDVVYLASDEFTASAVKEADVLVIRTRVKCNKDLLEGSSVKFIATATIGFDHIDVAYCKSRGITWVNAPGCNANSVCQYLESALLLIKDRFWNQLEGLNLGVIGVGHVGSKVADMAKNRGLNVLMNDPYRKIEDVKFGHTDLRTIQEQADIITFHVPLTHQGLYPTYHLADLDFMAHLVRKPILINTARGGVVNNADLLDALHQGFIKQAILDVWENEPQINTQLLEKVMIGTPHIAGYSADGKAKASEMALQAIADYFQLGLTISITPPSPLQATLKAKNDKDAFLQMYNPEYDSALLKASPHDFEFFRGNYRVRRESKAFTVEFMD